MKQMMFVVSEHHLLFDYGSHNSLNMRNVYALVNDVQKRYTNNIQFYVLIDKLFEEDGYVYSKL